MDQQADREPRPLLDEVLARFEAPLLRYALRLIGDAETARDVVQDAFLRLCRERPMPTDGHVGPWLYAVCRNRAIDLLRKENRMSALTAGMAAELTGAKPPDAAATPQTLVEDAESIGGILGLLATLPVNQQEVIRLKFQDGLTYAEIARVTKLSPSNVGFLIHVGLKAIRKKLAGEAKSASAMRAGGEGESS